MTQPTTSLNDLLQQLDVEHSATEYQQIINAINIPAEAFSAYCIWDENCYTRNCIIQNEYCELMIICWCEGHYTPVHDHSEQNCWMGVVQGQLTEQRFRETSGDCLDCYSEEILNPGDFSYINDKMGYHNIANTYQGKTASLHLYARPITRCGIIDPETSTSKERVLSFHSVDGVLT